MGLLQSIKTLDAEALGLHVYKNGELKRLQLTLLDIASFIKRVCDENGIEWGLCGGNALGAIRHKGFIPWDDDIDICMTRKNYEKFAAVFPKQDKYELVVPGEKDNYYHLPRVYDTETQFITLQTVGKGTGVAIDILIVEDMYDNRIRDFMHGVKCTYYLFVISCMATHKRKDNYIRYGNEELLKKAKLRDFFSYFFRYRPLEKWIEVANKYFGSINNPSSIEVSVPCGGKHYFGEIYKREDMCRFVLMQYEDREFPVYVGVHNIMRQRFGADYMQVPPENKREVHTCIAIDLGGKKQ